MQRLNVLGRTLMLRDYLTPSLPTLAIGLISVALGGDTFTGLHASFSNLPNGLLVALIIAAALRISFFLFADGAARTDFGGWSRGLCLVGVLLATAASAAGGALPGSLLSPIERMTLDGMIRAPAEQGGGAGSRAPPVGRRPSGASGLELVETLDRYAVEELGGLFLYAPKPEPAGRPRLQPWILLLQARKVIKNEPWVVYPDGIRAKVRANYPHLFDDDPARFYIYRLDKGTLARLMASL
jgi:hypothetical protein